MSTAIHGLELDDYQRAVRLLLSNPLITETYPDPSALPAIRRFADHLRADLLEAFGYRLELSMRTARLIRILDALDPSQPATTSTDRSFDRRRYAYLALTLAALGRAGVQIALSELADHVAGDARRIDGLGLSTERAADRSAFVDAVTWLEVRGAVRLADGSARRWADDPDSGEALYDIDQDAVTAIYRPTRVLQHMTGVGALLGGVNGSWPGGIGRDARRREAAQRAGRALVEQPVVYFGSLDEATRNMLRGPNVAHEVERLTGLVAERRAEGIAMLDTSGRFSDVRFPGSGTVAQATLLLIGLIAARLAGQDPPASRLPLPTGTGTDLVDQLDRALPQAGILAQLAGEPEPEPALDDAAEPTELPEPTGYPLIENTWLVTAMSQLIEQYGATFATGWRAEPERLLGAVLELLASLRMVAVVEGGVLILPLMARYREVAVQVRTRQAEASLFDEL